MPPLPDDADPAELANRLAAQAELLAVSAGLQVMHDTVRSDELRCLVAEAHELARRGREVAERHRRLALAEAAAGQVLDEGLLLLDAEPDHDFPFDAARAARAAVSRLLAAADWSEPPGLLPH
jgi:hypothetical protein